MSSDGQIKSNVNSYLDEIDRLIRDIEYGSLIIIIQDGKVIQVDKTQKIRL